MMNTKNQSENSLERHKLASADKWSNKFKSRPGSHEIQVVFNQEPIDEWRQESKAKFLWNFAFYKQESIEELLPELQFGFLWNSPFPNSESMKEMPQEFQAGFIWNFNICNEESMK